MQLGLIRLGNEEASQPNLPLARHAIDMLAMLNEKTRGNLTTEERRELENTLTELRFRYVQAAQEASKQAEPSAQSAAAADTGGAVKADS